MRYCKNAMYRYINKARRTHSLRLRRIPLLLVLLALPLFVSAQVGKAPRFDDATIRATADSETILCTNTMDEIQYATTSAEVFRSLQIGQSYASITNLLGSSPLKEPVVDLGSRHPQKPETARWHVCYPHSLLSG